MNLNMKLIILIIIFPLSLVKLEGDAFLGMSDVVDRFECELILSQTSCVSSISTQQDQFA
jgi:hypothetical protein